MAVSSVGFCGRRSVAGGVQYFGIIRDDVSDSMGPAALSSWEASVPVVFHPPGLDVPDVLGSEDGPKGACAWLDPDGKVLGHQNVWQEQKPMRLDGDTFDTLDAPPVGYIWRSKADLLPPVGQIATAENTGGETDTGADSALPGGSGSLTKNEKKVVLGGVGFGSLYIASLLL